MKQKPKEPRIPPETHDTIRKMIVAELLHGPRSARDLSSAVGIPEREVHGHLDHIQRSLDSLGRRLIVEPAVCNKCGFVFSKRERLSRPGKCPLCRGESIQEQQFSIGDRG